MSLRVATDVGGTFTDLVSFDEETKTVSAAKASTTPAEFSAGVLNAVDAGEVDLAEVGVFVHGCTVVINAITERKGVRVALLTTRGFRDVLEIARGNRPDMYNLLYRKPEPFVPRRLRFEVSERIGADGDVVTPLAPEELEEVAQACRDAKVEAVAICFLHSYANPAHEEQAAQELARLLPGVAIGTSAEITRQWREYERANTTVLNAYVQPVVERYLSALDEKVAERGLRGSRSIMQSNGGTASFERARRLPINLVESGPAGGIMGAAEIGRQIGEPNVIYFDIGGTTAKCTLIEAGSPKTTTDYKLEWSTTTAGYPVTVPVVDIVEIGAGGGSIAWVDEGGALHVGPESAGADPGPACYGKGGTKPTVTDAKLLAGVINPDYFLGGRLTVDAELSRGALQRLGEQVGLSAAEAANGVIRLANASMINALKLVSVRRGYDPRDFVLVACGGGGAMHAAALGAELRVKQVVVPPYPGYFSAWGMLVTEPRIDLVLTRVLALDDTDPAAVEELFSQLAEEAVGRLGLDDAGQVRTGRALEMRYHGQEHTVHVALDGVELTPEAITAAFHAAHERRYTFALADAPAEIVTFHLTAYQLVPRPTAQPIDNAGRSAEAAEKGGRPVDFDDDGVHECRVFERDLLPAGFEAEGPLVVEEASSTTLVHPGQTLRVDELGNLLIESGAH
jgi:N-methylhydantoinase A